MSEISGGSRITAAHPYEPVITGCVIGQIFMAERMTIKEGCFRFGFKDPDVFSEFLTRHGITWRRGAGHNLQTHQRRIDGYRAALKRGLSPERAAAEVGVTLSAIPKSCRRLGIATPCVWEIRRELREESVRTVRIKNPNMSRSQIGERLGLTKRQVEVAEGCGGRQRVESAADERDGCGAQRASSKSPVV